MHQVHTTLAIVSDIRFTAKILLLNTIVGFLVAIMSKLAATSLVRFFTLIIHLSVKENCGATEVTI